MSTYEIQIVVTSNGEDVHVKVPVVIPKVTYKIEISLALVVFAICDFIYAFSDKSCVHQKVDMGVNLYMYLLISAIFACIMILFAGNADKNVGGNCADIRTVFCGFNLAWTIVGAVIFWGKMDISTCSSTTHDYVYISLILKFIIKTFDIGETLV